MSSAHSRQRLPGLHVSFQRSNHAIKGISSGLLLGLTFGQRLRNSGKPDQPPPIALPLQRVSISKRHESVFQICFRQPQLMKHRVKQARPDFIPAILEGCKSSAVVEPPVTAFSMTWIEGDKHSTASTKLPDPPLEFAPLH